MAPDEPEIVVEFVGLPGAGKSTITHALPAHWKRRHDVPAKPLRLAQRLAVFRAALPLVLSLRPRRAKDVNRLRKFASEARLYAGRHGTPVVLDQGMLQKIWSTLIGRGYSSERLARMVAALAPYAPDLIIWVRTGPEEAAQRIASRQHGRSRFDNQPPAAIAAQIAQADRLYASLVSLYQKHTGCKVLELSGLDPVPESARKAVEAVRLARPGAAQNDSPANQN